MAKEDQLIYALGIVVMTGMEKSDGMTKFTSEDMPNNYTTHFPMPDGRWWHMTLQVCDENGKR